MVSALSQRDIRRKVPEKFTEPSMEPPYYVDVPLWDTNMAAGKYLVVLTLINCTEQRNIF